MPELNGRPKKIIFFNIPAFGHVAPTLPVIRQLSHSGHQVIAYCGANFQSSFETHGAEFRSYPAFDIGALTYRPLNMGCALLGAGVNLFHFIQEVVRKERPDRIVCDFMAIFAIYACRSMSEPVILTWPVVVPTPSAIRLRIKGQLQTGIWAFVKFVLSDIPDYLRFRRLTAKFHNISGLPRIRSPLEFFKLRGDRNIVFTIKELQPGLEELQREYGTYDFVGQDLTPSSNGEFPFTVQPGRPLLYITMGTVFNRQPTFFRQCLRAFGNTEWQVIMTTGGYDLSSLAPFPPNVIVRDFVPHAPILERASVILHHGGANTMHDAIHHKVPSVIRPWGADNYINALHTERLHAAIFLRDRKPSIAALQDAVATARSSPEIRAAIANLSTALVRVGGSAEAARVILRDDDASGSTWGATF